MHIPEAKDEPPAPAMAQVPAQRDGHPIRRARRFKLIGEEWKLETPDPAPGE